ncbi:MAG: DNA topoisomerase (ATP-hydrolyzing) subunit B [Clostridiales bacterium]|nr:DNA topoisomerase (ATP-hydrolyzing) subunit B [Clostridiales bacterium]
MSNEVNNNSYDENQIQILEGLEAVRKRPGMYIGSTSIRGLHHLVYEIVDNSVDEALAGFCKNIEVTLNKDNSVTVKDDGRGIPVGIHPTAGIPAVEVVFTILHAGGKFGGGGYKVSGGLHGVGASVVNALSNKLNVKIYHEGKIYSQDYRKGDAVDKLTVIGECDENLTGSEITFLPDDTIFEETYFDYDTLREHFQETVFLTKGLRITFTDKREEEEKQDSFCYEGGIKEFVHHINKDIKTPVYDDIFYCEGTKDDIIVEVAFQHNDGYIENNYSYVNNINTVDGGTHVAGFRTGLTKTVNDYCRRFGLLKDNDKNLMGEDIREGLVSVVSVKISDPQFEGQTKGKLGTSEAKNAVDSVLSEKLTYFLEENPGVAKAIFDKATLASHARDAAKKARELVRRKSVLETTRLPGKLSDCSEKDPSKCEIYIVEGNSAGGSAVDARTSKTQAILPLRGKILNVEKARLDRVLGNEEIKSMITAFGTGIHDEFDISKLRYHKIIIMTDADVDGAHITTLLLTFIFRFMRPLIEEGYVYLAKPPLYKIEKGNKKTYAYSDEERDEILKNMDTKGMKPIQRYKGLGEMDPEQLWETTMDPEKRTLIRVNMEDARRADEIFSKLMGDNVEPRKEFIREYAKFVTNLDV